MSTCPITGTFNVTHNWYTTSVPRIYVKNALIDHIFTSSSSSSSSSSQSSSSSSLSFFKHNATTDAGSVQYTSQGYYIPGSLLNLRVFCCYTHYAKNAIEYAISQQRIKHLALFWPATPRPYPVQHPKLSYQVILRRARLVLR